MRDPLNGISTSTLANAIVSNFGNPMDIDAVLAVLGQSLIEGAFSFGELIGFMECMNVPGLSNTLVNNFSNQTLLLQLILDNANQESILSLVMSRDPDFVKEVAESYPYLVAEAVRKLEEMSVEVYLDKVKKHYGDVVLGDLLAALSEDLLFAQKFVLNEHHLYGSSRLGVKTHKRVLLRKEFSISGFEEDGTYITDEVTDSLVYVVSSEYFCRVLAQKQYEMSNHLGNVLATVLDRRTGVFDETEDTLMYYEADVVSATLYYPFGSSMMEYKNADFNYSYDFNGKETDSETGLQDYGYRIYNKAYGKFLSMDPLHRDYPWNSTYAFAENDVIRAIDLEGKEKWIITRYFDQAGNYMSSHIRLVSVDPTNGFLTLYRDRILNPDGTTRLALERPTDVRPNDNIRVWNAGFLNPLDAQAAQTSLINFTNDINGNNRGETGHSYNAGVNQLTNPVNAQFNPNSATITGTSRPQYNTFVNQVSNDLAIMPNLNVVITIGTRIAGTTPADIANRQNLFLNRQNMVIANLSTQLGAGVVNQMIADGRITFVNQNVGPGQPIPFNYTYQVTPPATVNLPETQEDKNEFPSISTQ